MPTEGGYAEYSVAPAWQLWGLPVGLDYAAAGARVIATAGGVWTLSLSMSAKRPGKAV